MSAGLISGRQFGRASNRLRRMSAGLMWGRQFEGGMRESAAMTVRAENRGDGVLVVTIDRPEVRNAVDGPTATALADEFRRFDADDDLAVAVLTGAGRTFCAGADLTDI